MDSPIQDPSSLLRFIVVDRIPLAIGVAILAWVASRITARVLDGAGERFTGYRLQLKQVSTIGRFLIIFLASLLILNMVLHLSEDAVFAVGGSAAVAVGFAFKDLLASLIAGIILLFDRPFQVGDRVEFNGTYGEVVEIGLRTVRVVTLDDNLVSIPNNRFLSEVVSCANAGALDQMCVFNFHIGCDQDLRKAKGIIREATATSRYVYLRKPISIIIREEAVANAETIAIRITAKAYVLDGRFEVAFGTDITERVRYAFREAGILTEGDVIQNSRGVA